MGRFEVLVESPSGHGRGWSQAWMACRIVFAYAFAGGVFFGMSWAYEEGYTLAHDRDYILALGIYGVVLFAQLGMQLLFAVLEHAQHKLNRQRGAGLLWGGNGRAKPR